MKIEKSPDWFWGKTSQGLFFMRTGEAHKRRCPMGIGERTVPVNAM